MSNGRYVDQTHIGRRQSPAMEEAAQDRLASAFKTLAETKSLYQNVHIPTDFLAEFADATFTAEQLSEELSARPVWPVSRGEGDDAVQRQDVRHFVPAANGHDIESMWLSFYLPTVRSLCARCRKETEFLSMMCSGPRVYGGPYPILGDKTHQVFHLIYRCGVCREHFLAFQIARHGLRFQLTGRSEPYRPAVSSAWPKQVRDVVTDAVVAVSEGDLPAGYYHLRTAIEFLMKDATGKKPVDRVDGTELCESYARQLDIRARQMLPSLTPIYDELSAGLHARDVDAQAFESMLTRAIDHLTGKDLFSRYTPKPSQAADSDGIAN